MSDRKQATIEVPTKGGEPKEDKEPQLPPGPNPELKDLDKEKAKDAEMSAEDAALKERLELAVERATQEREPGLQTAALELLRSEIKGATSSMTSVPKPFKFLSPHFKTLRAAFEGPAPSKSPASGTAASSASAAAPLSPNAVPSGAKFVDPAVRRLAADILSVLAMTMGEEGKRDCLRFKFLGNTGDASASASVEQREKAEEEAIGSWGGEYVRHLSGELGQEYQHRQEKEGDNADYADLLAMIKIVVRYNLKHNAEVEAVDLLLETEQLDLLLVPNAVDESSHGRVCLYLLRCSDYAADVSEAEHTQQIAFSLYLSHKQFTQALVVALRMGGPTLKDRIDQVFTACEDRATRKQMGHLLGRHRAMSYIAKDDGESRGKRQQATAEGERKETTTTTTDRSLHTCLFAFLFVELQSPCFFLFFSCSLSSAPAPAPAAVCCCCCSRGRCDRQPVAVLVVRQPGQGPGRGRGQEPGGRLQAAPGRREREGE